MGRGARLSISPRCPSPVPSRSLLFYDEGASSWEDGRGTLLPVEPPEGWDIQPGGPAEQRPQDPLQHDHLDGSHETTKYLGKAWPEGVGGNGTDPDFSHPEDWFQDRWGQPLPAQAPPTPVGGSDSVIFAFSLPRDLGPNATLQLS